MTNWKDKPEDFWREQLSEEAYAVCREKGTERPFSGELNDEYRPGHYYCVCCGQLLFEGETKFNAGCGWPSFYAAAEGDAIDERPDNSMGMTRTEITCSGCGSHLGHVFEDGPPPTGLRYCLNSVAMTFEPADEDEDE